MSIESEFLTQISTRFKQAFNRIAYAAGQLNDEQVWQRPASQSNNIGIILQHLTGNLNQWVCSSIGGSVYERNRSAEFADARRHSKNELLGDFAQLGETVQKVLSAIPQDSLMSIRRIQDSDYTILAALLFTVTHLELHAGQVTYIAKLLLNERYSEQQRPKAP